jgi:hypothetical protein
LEKWKKIRICKKRRDNYPSLAQWQWEQKSLAITDNPCLKKQEKSRKKQGKPIQYE